MDKRIELKSIARFRRHEETTLESQITIKDDQQKLIQNSQQAARELEQFVEADVREEETLKS